MGRVAAIVLLGMSVCAAAQAPEYGLYEVPQLHNESAGDRFLLPYHVYRVRDEGELEALCTDAPLSLFVLGQDRNPAVRSCRNVTIHKLIRTINEDPEGTFVTGTGVCIFRADWREHVRTNFPFGKITSYCDFLVGATPPLATENDVVTALLSR